MPNLETFKGKQGNAKDIENAEKAITPQQTEASRIRELLMTKDGMDKVNEVLIGKSGHAVVQKNGQETELDLGRLLRVRFSDSAYSHDHGFIADFENMSIGDSPVLGYTIVKNEVEYKSPERTGSVYTVGDTVK